jgi:hypothetical protein
VLERHHSPAMCSSSAAQAWRFNVICDCDVTMAYSVPWLMPMPVG